MVLYIRVNKLKSQNYATRQKEKSQSFIFHLAKTKILHMIKNFIYVILQWSLVLIFPARKLTNASLFVHSVIITELNLTLIYLVLILGQILG